MIEIKIISFIFWLLAAAWIGAGLTVWFLRSDIFRPQPLSDAQWVSMLKTIDNNQNEILDDY